MIDIASEIKRLRTKQKISIRKLAQLTGYNISNLSRIENGKIPPRIDTLQRILDALNAEIEIKEKDG